MRAIITPTTVAEQCAQCAMNLPGLVPAMMMDDDIPVDVLVDGVEAVAPQCRA